MFGTRFSRRRLVFLGADISIIAIAVGLGFLLRFEGAIPARRYQAIPMFVGVMVLTTIPALWYLQAYRTNLRFVALMDILRIGIAIGVGTLLTGLIIHLLHAAVFMGAPRSVVVIQAPFAFLGIAGYRLGKRAQNVLRKELNGHDGEGEATLIVGAGDAGSQIARSLLEEPQASAYDVVGFLDDDPQTHGTLIEDAPVLGPLSALETEIASKDVEVLIIAIANVRSDLVRDVDARAREAGVETVRIVPPVTELIDQDVSFGATREISLEDLLGRDPVHIADTQLAELIEGKCVCVTGGAGTIGSELARQVARYRPRSLLVLDIDESRLHETVRELDEQFDRLAIEACLVDVRDADAVGEVFARHDIDLVYHAAAYKHVPMMEHYPDAALATNVLGTHRVLEAAADANCERFVFVSTDKAVNPSSIMGASKRIAEHLVLERVNLQTSMVCTAVRFGNVLGSRGSVIPIFERQLEEGGPLTVTHPDAERYFMTTSEAASLVVQASSMGEQGDLFLLDMGEPVQILELAHEFIRLHGFEPEVEIPIEIIGLRDGEKLSEELTGDTEEVYPSSHQKINRVRTEHGDVSSVNLARLEAIVDSRDREQAHAVIMGLLAQMEAPPIEGAG